jgi:hypothetical protein
MDVRKNNAPLKKKNSSEQRTTPRYVIMMSTKTDAYDYLEFIPDEDLVMLAKFDWEGLETFCMLLTLDKQIQAEAEQKRESQIPS